MSRKIDGSGMKPRSVGARWRSSSSRGDAAREQQLIDQIVGLEAGVAGIGRRARASARAGRGSSARRRRHGLEIEHGRP